MSEEKMRTLAEIEADLKAGKKLKYYEQAKEDGMDKRDALKSQQHSEVEVKENLGTKDASRAKRDLELWHKWNESGKQNPDHLGDLLAHIDPIIQSESNKYLQSGIDPGLLKSHASNLAFQALHSFDPNMGIQLNTHIMNHTKKLSRYAIKNQNAIRAPEEHIYGYRAVLKAKQEFFEEHGREPTERELKDFSPGIKIGDFNPTIEHYYSRASESGMTPAMEELNMDPVALGLIHDELSPTQKTIFEHTTGYNGAQILPKKDIAAKLKISPPGVTKHLKKIEKLRQKYNRIL